jgi:hypothetical protein
MINMREAMGILTNSERKREDTEREYVSREEPPTIPSSDELDTPEYLQAYKIPTSSAIRAATYEDWE